MAKIDEECTLFAHVVSDFMYDLTTSQKLFVASMHRFEIPLYLTEQVDGKYHLNSLEWMLEHKQEIIENPLAIDMLLGLLTEDTKVFYNSFGYLN